jgi:hypothetical protein
MIFTGVSTVSVRYLFGSEQTTRVRSTTTREAALDEPSLCGEGCLQGRRFCDEALGPLAVSRLSRVSPVSRFYLLVSGVCALCACIESFLSLQSDGWVVD